MKKVSILTLYILGIICFIFCACLQPTDPNKEPGDKAPLLEKLDWISKNAKSNSEYTIIVTKNEVIHGINLSFPDKEKIKIRIKGDEEERIISPRYIIGDLFSIKSGVTLILDENISLQGINENIYPLVWIEGGGKLIMNEGSKITGNSTKAYHNRGAGVCVCENAFFTMNGGIIANNNGNGVYLEKNASFTMTGGKISDNTSVYGGGVYISPNSNFNFEGGEISNNIGTWGGGGVYMEENASLIIKNGKIFGNSVLYEYGEGGGIYGGSILMSGGEISNNTAFLGGGLSRSNITIKGGKIKGNTAERGGGISWGSITMSGGEIYDNTAEYGSGLYSRNFTMLNGNISNNKIINDGYSYTRSGAVHILNSFIMENGTISDNSGTGVFLDNANFNMKGGAISNNRQGIHSESDSSIILDGGTISFNSSLGIDASSSIIYLKNGEIIYNDGGGVLVNAVSTFLMSGGKISGNSNFGGVYVWGILFSMMGGEISNNTSVMAGGGGVSTYGHFVMNGGEIFGNTAGYGGGIYVYTPDRSSITKTGGTIYGHNEGEKSNTATYGIGSNNCGHAIYFRYGAKTLRRETTSDPNDKLSLIDQNNYTGDWD